MAVLKCKMCGGELEIIEGSNICVCQYCETKQTVPTMDNDKKLTLFSRANRLRFNCEFDKAYSVYEAIIAEFSEEAEAYWGLVLCKYGVEYVDDPKTAKKIPTCHRSSFDSVMDDENFEKACEYAGIEARALYREEAKQIEELRRGIIEISSSQDPYDIFICYKETDVNGNRTMDSVIAQDVYEALTRKGYKVFFSRISLEDKLGREYEPYIFSALHSAKIMLVFGTDYEHFNAVWVKNEWSRFLKLMEKDEEKALIPCFKGIDAYDMPKEFVHLQSQDMGKLGAIQDLLRGIEKILDSDKKEETVIIQASGNDEKTVSALLKRANTFFKCKDYIEADKYFEKALDISPNNEEALIGKLLVELQVESLEEAKNLQYLFHKSKNYKYLMLCCKAETKKQVDDILNEIKENLLNEAQKEMKNRCFRQACKIYDDILDYEAENEKALVAKVFIHYGVIDLRELELANINFSNEASYKNLLKSCSDATKKSFEKCLANIESNIEQERKKKNRFIKLAMVVLGMIIAIALIALVKYTQTPKYIWGLEKIGDGWVITSTNKIGKKENGHLEIPAEIDGKPVLKIGDLAFENCDFSSITIPSSVIYIGERAFYNCSSLTSIEIPNGIMSIGNATFYGCSSLASIEIPNSVTSIGSYAFADCSSLTNIIIPNSVTDIDNWAFENCTRLTKVEIPNSVIYIGDFAFRGCSSLTVYCEVESQPNDWSHYWNNFDSCPVVWGFKGD